MADSARASTERRHLDATGSRAVAYCHACEHEWYQDENGLKCPQCDSEAIEIVTAESDPREINEAPEYPQYSDFTSSPWSSRQTMSPRAEEPEVEAEEPEEQNSQNIQRHIQTFPGGRVVITGTMRTFGGPNRRQRSGPNPNSPAPDIFRDFQDMVAEMMGPRIRMGEPGRSGPDTLFGRGEDGTRQGRMGTTAAGGPTFHTQRYTFVSPHGLRPRNATQPQPVEETIDPFQTLIEELFNPGLPGDRREPNLGSDDEDGHDREGYNTANAGIPRGLQSFFASLFNPANAVHGDAVYSQEALDRIISTLMEQHPSSNAPGPAPEAAIASLPKKKLDEEMLGPELKGECSVCMDDVHVGVEVVVLPCKHWFHEACAAAWLREHNTCPICRKGIGESTPQPATAPTQPPTSTAPPEAGGVAGSDFTSFLSPRIRRSARDEARLESIRQRSRLSPSPLDSGLGGSSTSHSRYESVRRDERSPSPPFHLPMHQLEIPMMRERDSELTSGQWESRRLAETRRDRDSDRDRSTRDRGGGGTGGWGGNLGSTYGSASFNYNFESPPGTSSRGSRRRGSASGSSSGTTQSHSSGGGNNNSGTNGGGSSSHGGGGGGAMSWIRDHLPGSRRHG